MVDLQRTTFATWIPKLARRLTYVRSAKLSLMIASLTLVPSVHDLYLMLVEDLAPPVLEFGMLTPDQSNL